MTSTIHLQTKEESFYGGSGSPIMCKQLICSLQLKYWTTLSTIQLFFQVHCIA